MAKAAGRARAPWMTAEAVLDLYRQVPRKELRALTSLGQHLSIGAIEVLMYKNWDILANYTDRFPELAALKQYLDERAELFRKDPRGYIRYSVYRRVTPELREINSKIIATHRSLRRQLYELAKVIADLKQQGLIEAEKANPDVRSRHFQVAQEFAQQLVRLWFVNEAILFGSVARGEARPDSDIDICLGLVPTWVSSFLYRMVEWLAQEAQARYAEQLPGLGRNLFDLLRDQPWFREMGFMEAGYTLAKDDTYRFTLDKGTYTFEKTSMFGYSIDLRRDRFYSSVLYPVQSADVRFSYDCVLLVDCDAVALFSALLKPRGQGFRLDLRLKDARSDLLSEYELGGRALAVTAYELVADAVRRVHKTKYVYHGPR